MDLEQLKSEGRRLARPARVLSTHGTGGAVAWRYDGAGDQVLIAMILEDQMLLVSPDGHGGGQTRLVNARPPGGVPLYEAPWLSMAPIDAIFLFGNQEVGEWLTANKWQRDWAYNGNFADRTLVEAYEAWWSDQHPFYSGGAAAIMGGWHLGWPDDDWNDLLDSELLLWTMDGEPWIEVWRSEDGLRVIERVT